MKYVLMYTSRPDLAGETDPEAAQAIYKRVYEWFGENAGVMADSGAELLGVETATTVKHGSDGAVVVVIGWRDATGASSFLPLSSMKLRRGTFECFAGRGAVAQVTRRGLDYQVNVMIGDRASTETVDAAFDAARSIVAAPRRHD